jgi:hypothetical protein
MTLDLQTKQRLMEKIQQLSPQQVPTLEDFIDFLYSRNQTTDQNLVQVSARLAENAFAKVWDNPEDADYDNL